MRRVSGSHHPSPFTKGGGVGEGDSAPWPGHAARPPAPTAAGRGSASPLPATRQLPTRRPHPPLVPPSPRRGRGENARVRRVSGSHRPSPFTKGGGVGEGDSAPWPGHAARPLGTRSGPGRPPGRPCLRPADLTRRHGEHRGRMFSRLGTRPPGEATPRPYPLPATCSLPTSPLGFCRHLG